MNLSGLRKINENMVFYYRVHSCLWFHPFSLLCQVSGEEVRTEGTEKIAKTTLIENSTPGPQGNRYDLASIISYALKNNPGLRMAEKDIEV